ncbi:hypothetical protein AB6A40_006653 [Gnathostoma spinigerum]|uniref:Uncharacterized protein n=1 Tax=Gnathostoma spinigerum TaxID=75299 RepID=A0ABD6EP60_9BILA
MYAGPECIEEHGSHIKPYNWSFLIPDIKKCDMVIKKDNCRSDPAKATHQANVSSGKCCLKDWRSTLAQVLLTETMATSPGLYRIHTHS